MGEWWLVSQRARTHTHTACNRMATGELSIGKTGAVWGEACSHFRRPFGRAQQHDGDTNDFPTTRQQKHLFSRHENSHQIPFHFAMALACAISLLALRASAAAAAGAARLCTLDVEFSVLFFCAARVDEFSLHRFCLFPFFHFFSRFCRCFFFRRCALRCALCAVPPSCHRHRSRRSSRSS